MNDSDNSHDPTVLLRFWGFSWIGIVSGGALLGSALAIIEVGDTAALLAGGLIGAMCAACVATVLTPFLCLLACACRISQSRTAAAVGGASSGLASIAGVTTSGDAVLPIGVVLFGGLGGLLGACLGKPDGFKIGSTSVGGLLMRTTWLIALLVAWRLVAVR